MSKVTIAGDANGTGVFTIAAPNGNTNRTLTLPDEAGTIDTLQRAGNVLQVVALTNSTRQVLPTSVDYWVSFGTITKISTTSKLVVAGTFNGWDDASGACGVGIRINTLYRYGNFTYEENALGKNHAINADFGVMSVGEHTVYWGWKVANGSASNRPFVVFNPDNADDARSQQSTSVILVTEVEA
jgi:hypothetical protein